MGTRHLIAVQVDGRYGVAQYGQWDGYPSGQGVDVLAFLKETDLAKFAAKVRATHFIGQEESDVVNASGDNWKRRYPQLSRDAGSDVLGMVRDAPDGIWLKNSIDFAGDSLFCEFAYVIDLDAGRFEVFKGFNQSPVAEGERFNGAPKDKEDSKYTPVKLWTWWPLSDLPEEKAFLDALDEPEE